MLFVTFGFMLFWTPQAIQILWIITGLGKAPRIFPLTLAVLAPLSSEVCHENFRGICSLTIGLFL